MMRYFILKTGTVVTDSELQVAYEALTGERKIFESIDEICSALCGVDGEIKYPTAETMLRLGREDYATRIQSEKTSCSISEARRKVREMSEAIEDMDRVALEKYIDLILERPIRTHSICESATIPHGIVIPQDEDDLVDGMDEKIEKSTIDFLSVETGYGTGNMPSVPNVEPDISGMEDTYTEDTYTEETYVDDDGYSDEDSGNESNDFYTENPTNTDEAYGYDDGYSDDMTEECCEYEDECHFDNAWDTDGKIFHDTELNGEYIPTKKRGLFRRLFSWMMFGNSDDDGYADNEEFGQ